MKYLPQPDIRFYERVDKYCHYYNYNVYEGWDLNFRVCRKAISWLTLNPK
jgi:hypothetical protein